jgi:hypothetical protein
MSRTSTIALVFGLFVTTATCRGDLPLIVGPHLTTADHAQNLAASAINLQAKMAELTAMIKQARARFWKEYPHGKDFAAAEAAFSEALWNKNGAYLQICLPRGINDDLVDQMNMFGDAPALTAQQWHGAGSRMSFSLLNASLPVGSMIPSVMRQPICGSPVVLGYPIQVA